MSQLNYLEKLLDGVEVEWIALREVVKTVTAPAKLKRESYRETGKTPIIDQGEKFITGYTDEDVKALPLGEYVIFGDHSEHIKYVDFSFIQGADGLKILKSISDNPKYVYYSFLNFYKKELNYKRHWASASETLIPIPCPDNPEKSLAIQAEIVRILDAFTAMTAELTAELNMRKKQYNYYRDQLLSFDLSADQAGEGDVEWVKLSTVANIKNGKDWKKLGSGKIPVYGSGGIMQYVDTFAYNKPTVLIPRKGSITNIFYVDEPFWNVDTIYYTELDLDKIIPKFFYYFMTTIDIMQLDTGSGRPSLTQAILNEIKIPLPTLEEQARIISLLDKFDTLTTSLQEGLPREIELRQKQYEYYRDLLLSFPASPAGGPKSHSDEAA